MNTRRFRVLFFVACLLPVDVAVGISLLGAQAVALLLMPLLAATRRVPAIKPPQTSTVTVQILSWDGRPLLEEFLPSVLEAVGSSNEVVVVDNGSTDDTVEFLRTKFPRVRVVQLDRNYGFSGGNNRGMKQVTTDIVVLLNNDMATDRHFLQPLLKPFSDPAVFAVASQIAMADPAKSRFETGKTRGRFEAGLFNVWHDGIEPPEKEKEAIPVFWAGGGACAIDRRKFEMLGGFDSLYSPFYVEDTDLSYQAWKRGWKALLAPASRVIHKHRGTSGPRFGDLFVNNTTRRNHYLFVWKNVTDLGMVLEHLRELPWIHGRAISQYGAAFEYRAYLRAFVRLPLAVRRRLANLRNYVVGDRDIPGLTR
jgi:GT2 family glycosyltransferase